MGHRTGGARRAAAGLTLAAALAAGLGGCTGSTGAMSDAFVDPSIYELYDCKQLATERASVVRQLEDNQKLIDKARTGVAGEAVAGLAYGNTNLSLQGKMRLIDRMWQESRCDSAAVQGPAVQR